MERLAETTPNCPSEIIAAFNEKFKDMGDIALPVEVNGLHKIQIYRAETHTETPVIIVPEEPEPRFKIRVQS